MAELRIVTYRIAGAMEAGRGFAADIYRDGIIAHVGSERPSEADALEAAVAAIPSVIAEARHRGLPGF